MKISALLALTSSLVIASYAVASSKSKSHKKEKSSLRSTKSSKAKSKQQLSEEESNPVVEQQTTPTWIAATSYGTDSTCKEKSPLPPTEGSWAYRSFPLGTCVPSSSGETTGSFKYEYVSEGQGRHTTYTDSSCQTGGNAQLFNIGSCQPIASGSTYYSNLHYRTHAAGDYYAPMMWTYYASDTDCDAAIGENVDIVNSVHGYATYAYPDPDCWLDYPMAGNITHVQTFGKHLKFCTGYTKNDCSDARTSEDNVPHCHTVNSCSSVNTNEVYGDYWMSFDTFRATQDDDIGDKPMIGNPH